MNLYDYQSEKRVPGEIQLIALKTISDSASIIYEEPTPKSSHIFNGLIFFDYFES